MNFNELNFIKKKLNEILEYNDELRKVSWLYIPKLHPSIIKNYETILNNKTYLKNTFLYYLNICFKIIKLFAYFFYISFFIKKFQFSNQNHNNYDLLILSHLINNNKINFKNDYIFNGIIDKLNNKNYKSFIVYLNHFNNYNNNYILSKNIGFKNNIKFTIKYLKLFYRYFSMNKLKNFEFNYKLKRKLILEILSTSNIYNEIISEQIIILLLKLNIKNILITYEGYALERFIINKVKKSKVNIRCIAYNHSGLWPGQNSMKLDMGNNYNPDIIYFAGKIHNRRFFNANKIKIKTGILGSNRNFQVKKIQSNEHLTVLFLPEGILDEVKNMLSFALKICASDANINCIFRFHPDINSQIKNLSIYTSKYNNLTFSKNTFEDDLSISNLAIYRGSTTCVAALANKIIPIYYDLGDNINIDFLYDFSEFKFKVSNLNEFNKIKNNYKKIMNTHNAKKDKIEKYCEEIFYNKIKLINLQK